MTQYQQPTFTVPMGHRTPDECQHGWTTAKGECVFCGTVCPTANRLPTRRYGSHVCIDLTADGSTDPTPYYLGER